MKPETFTCPRRSAVSASPYVITGRRLAEEMAREQTRASVVNMWAVLVVGASCLAGIIGAAAWSSERANTAFEQGRRVG